MSTARKIATTEIHASMDTELWEKLDFDPIAVVEQGIRLALSAGQMPDGLESRDLEIGAALSDDDTIQTLNGHYRQKDKPTNVLSFAAVDDPDYEMTLKMPGPFYLGDIILAYETIEREAAEYGISFHNHLIYLSIHGTLHLLGYDHIEDDEAEKMESIEIKLLASLGIENPYEL